MIYYEISVIYGMVPIFINCVYLKFNNPDTGYTVYQYHVLIGTHQGYFWPGSIILALYQAISLTFSLNVNLEKRLFWPDYISFNVNTNFLVISNSTTLKSMFLSIYIRTIVCLGGQYIFFDVIYKKLIFCPKKHLKPQKKYCHPPIPYGPPYEDTI